MGAFEVIVADGGSPDDTCRIAAASGARVLSAPLGRASQQNAGAAAAVGDVLLFQHADTWFDQPAAPQISDALKDSPQRWGGAFRQRIEANAACYRWLERGNAVRVRFRGLPFGDQGIFVRREVFRQSGGFPLVDLMEDLILMRQLRKQSWPLLLDGPICVSARRWQTHGVIRQTVRNWSLQLAWHFGVSPNRLARYYRRHESTLVASNSEFDAGSG